MTGRGPVERVGSSLLSAAATLRQGRETTVRLGTGAELHLEPVRGAQVRTDDLILARVPGDRMRGSRGGRPVGMRLVLGVVTATDRERVRLSEAGWVLFENIFGKVA